VVLPSPTPCKNDNSESALNEDLWSNSPKMVTVQQQTDDDLKCPPSLEPKTPIGPYNIAGKISSATPLDKFNAFGSDLMVCMIFLLFLIHQQPVLV
jgi:hypothetical protein